MDVNGAACLLVAERDEDDRLVRRLLAGSGYALQRGGPEDLAERPFDAVMVAAGDDGLAIARALLARAPHVPVVLLSEHPDLACDLAAAAAGVADYLVLGELDAALLERSLRYAVASQRTRRALAESEERYALAVRGASDGIWDWDLRSGHFFFSPPPGVGFAAEEIEDAIGEWLGRVHPDDRAALRGALQAHVDGLTPQFECEHRLRARDGGYRWILARGLAVRDAAGRATRVAGSLTDVSERKRTEERLQHDALHDGLTGLPNRMLFLDRVEQAMRRAARRGDDVVCAVLFVDLDRFKAVNDSLGHQAGDELLTAVARRLESALRPGDTVARLGGDEFTVLLEEISDVHEATRVAERIHATLADSFRIAGRELVVGASIGIALASAHARPEELVRDADVAMYRAKAEGRGRHEIFDARMHAELLARLDVEGELRAAIESGSIEVLYQPVVQTATGRIAGFEALCRWPGALGRALDPVDVIGLAAETGLIPGLGALILDEACRQVAAWRRTPAGEGLTLGVNVSGRELREPAFADTVAAALIASGLDPRALRLEVAESALAAEPDAVRATLAALLDRLGVRSRIDGFGTGAASLRHLHGFPGDAVKIDRSLVLGMGADAGSYEIVKAIVGLAHTLGLEVVAVGVETRERLDILKVLGCEFAQGFLLSAPLQAAEAAALLEAGAAGARL